MGIRGWITLGGVVAALGLPAAARADTTVTIAPVTGANYKIIPDSSGSSDEVTDTRTPTFVIAANAPGTLSCQLDSGAAGACGPSPAGCPAGDVCAAFTPTLGGTGAGDSHSVEVQLLDSDGSELARAFDYFTLDLTPPDTKVSAADAREQNTPLRPALTAFTEDDSSGNHDTLQCSLVPAGKPVRWTACPVNDDGYATYSPRLPDRHVDYTFSARTTDVFGRVDPTPASVLYDPVPCALTVAPVSARSLSRSPVLTVSLSCTGVSDTIVNGLMRQRYGKRAQSESQAAHSQTSLFYQPVRLRSRGGHATGRVRVKVGSGYSTYFRHFRTVSFYVLAGNSASLAEDGETTVTVRR